MAVKKSRRKSERRTSERADAKLSMRVEGGRAEGASAHIVTETQNISSSGIYCHSSHFLAPLSKVQLTIVLPKVPGNAAPQQLLKCDGIVVRCDQRPGKKSETSYELACMFAGLDSLVRERIEEFVAWRNLQSLRAALRPTPRRTATVKKAARRTPARRTTASTRTTRGARRTGR